jgi:hypothetical protein
VEVERSPLPLEPPEAGVDAQPVGAGTPYRRAVSRGDER